MNASVLSHARNNKGKGMYSAAMDQKQQRRTNGIEFFFFSFQFLNFGQLHLVNTVDAARTRNVHDTAYSIRLAPPYVFSAQIALN